MRELALHLLDLAQNSLAAGASRLRIEIRLDAQADRLSMTVRDDGRGIPPEILAVASDPFVTTRKTRRVGLGLSLLAAAAERAEGGLSIESREGEGTTVTAAFRASSIDRAPLGDLAGTVMALLACNPDLELELVASWDKAGFAFSTVQWREALGERCSLADPSSLVRLREHLRAGLADLRRAEDAAAGMQWRDN